ncbi:hypothetical protein MVEN_01831100 [Mycena venus]|uniref:Transmembrane protein n=1 Tax=Mycena venus TaxID=2733690 RepID=A0A8H6XL09_9AGAR|nr:hypothetical protein MVEN_01831100 [Mycena venus]
MTKTRSSTTLAHGTVGGASAEFDVTTSIGTQPGATASFTFTGTSIAVYGTLPSGNASRPLTFVVDNAISGAFENEGNLPTDTHHVELWASPALSNSKHTLVITQPTTLGVFLDYFLYNTTSTSGVGSYFIDDRDPRITYTPAWRQDDSEIYFQNTAQASASPGDSFSVAFEGKAISFFGPVNDTSMSASMAIDGGPPVLFTPSRTGPNIAIYNSGDLTDGKHTLVVTAQNEHPVWADYFLVTPSNSSGPSPSNSPSPSPSPSKSSPPIGIIVGSVVGAVVLIALLIAIFLFLRRQKRDPLRETQLDLNPTIPMEHVSQPGPSVGYGAAEFTRSSVPLLSVGSTTHPNPSVSSGPSVEPTQLAHPLPSPALLSNKLAREANARNIAARASQSRSSDISGLPSSHSRDNSDTADVPPPQYFEALKV